MKITQITVSAGRTFNDPYESYSNYKPHLTLTATLDPDDIVIEAVQKLQAKAEQWMDEHKQKMLADLSALHEASEIRQEVCNLERKIELFTERLNAIKRNAPELPAAEEKNNFDLSHRWDPIP